MFKKLENTPITIVMFIVIFCISLISVSIMTYTSIRSAHTGLYKLGDQSVSDIHKTMMLALKALDGETKFKLQSGLTALEMQMMDGDDLYVSNETSRIGGFIVPVMKKGTVDVYSQASYVDTITRKTGAKTTIFQLVDNKLLRIATSVVKKNGERAVGTSIDSNSPVFKSIMNGQTFFGKAFVVDDWYLTAYSPLYDKDKNIIGAVFVGNLMLGETVQRLINNTRIGEGYFFVYGNDGTILIHPTLDSSSNLYQIVPEFKDSHTGIFTYDYNGDEKIAIAESMEGWGVNVAVGLRHDDVLQGIDETLLKQSTLIGFLVLLLGIALTFMLVRMVNSRVTRLAAIAAKVGGGDYRVSFDVKSKDALGDLSDSLNHMVDNSKEMLRQINDSTKSLGSASTQLSSISTELVESSIETSAIAERTSNNANEVSGNMDSVAAASEESATNLNMIAAATEEMGNTIQEIASNSSKASLTTNEAVDVSQRSQEAVESLGKAASSIGKVTEQITEISAQTNLLALNATIEAARAGDAGKGFAVVANEIKELAKETATATNSIRDAINEIQAQTNNTIADIGGITKVIAEVNDIVQGIVTAVEEQSITTNEIVQNVNQASQGIAEVNESISNTSQMTAEVSSDVGLVEERSVSVKANSEHLQQSAANLDELSQDLSSLVARFKV